MRIKQAIYELKSKKVNNILVELLQVIDWDKKEGDITQYRVETLENNTLTSNAKFIQYKEAEEYFNLLVQYNSRM
jgi:hypothetical protein